MAGRKPIIVYRNHETFEVIKEASPSAFRKVIIPFLKNAIAGTAKRLSLAVTLDAIARRSIQHDKNEAKAESYGVIPKTKTIIRALMMLDTQGSITVNYLMENLKVSKPTALQVIRIIGEGKLQERIKDSLKGFLSVTPLVLTEAEAEALPY